MDLFGKKKLEDRIQELEDSIAVLQGEKEELLRTLKKREDKIRMLASAYQEANQSRKAAEQKAVAVSAVMPPSSVPDTKGWEKRPKGTNLSPREMEKLIARLSTCRSPQDDLSTVLLPPGASLPAEANTVGLEAASERGWIILRYPELFTLLLVPPFPVLDSLSTEGGGLQLDPLRKMLETPVLVISAHAGETFLGISFGKDGFETQELVESQVKEKHSKGGWSQKRFERLRDEDIKNHVEAVVQRLSDLQERYGSVVRFAVLGGDATLMRQIAPAIRLPTVERRLDRHDKRQTERLLDEVYSFMCYRIWLW
jgi:hypothetical protein